MSKGKVNKIIEFSSVDGLGNRFALFLQGCNLNCLYCHNPETITVCNHCNACIWDCPNDALNSVDRKVVYDKTRCDDCGDCEKLCPYGTTPKNQELSAEEVFELIKKVQDFIRGITVSGGECTLQIGFLHELFKLTKSHGLTNYIDTNGTNPLWFKKDFMELVDGVMLDVKAFDEEEHRVLTGAGNGVILRNLDYLIESGKLHEVRTVVADGVCDNELTIREVSQKLAEANSDATYKIITYRERGVRESGLEKLTPPSQEEMETLRQLALSLGVKKVIVV